MSNLTDYLESCAAYRRARSMEIGEGKVEYKASTPPMPSACDRRVGQPLGKVAKTLAVLGFNRWQGLSLADRYLAHVAFFTGTTSEPTNAEITAYQAAQVKGPRE